MRSVLAIWITAVVLCLAGAASAQTADPAAPTDPPAATVAPEPTQPPVEATQAPADPVDEPDDPTQAPADPAVPGTTDADDDDGLSSTAIALMIAGAAILGLIIFGIAMSQRRTDGPDRPLD